MGSSASRSTGCGAVYSAAGVMGFEQVALCICMVFAAIAASVTTHAGWQQHWAETYQR
jgi:hypothetical protein